MTVTLPLLVWLATIVAVVVVDLGAYLVAASRAQTLADHAALAAVSADAGAVTGRPQAEAAAVVERGGGHLEACRCAAGTETAQVTVSVAVPGLVVPTLGFARVEADGAAMLAPPEDLPPGPTRERARWPRPDREP